MTVTTCSLIALVNEKGGCGKTTLAINLAGELARRGRHVAVADADGQRSASRWAEQGSDLPFTVQALDLIGRNAARFQGELERLSEAAGADLVLIDCPPGLPAAAMVALLLADLALIPAAPSPLDFWAVENAVTLIDHARQERGGHLPAAALVPWRVVPQTVLGREAAEALMRYGLPVAPAVSQRVAFAESAIAGQTLGDYDPQNPAVDELKQLGSFVLRQLKGTAR
jgi:chromosome partitioning protein